MKYEFLIVLVLFFSFSQSHAASRKTKKTPTKQMKQMKTTQIKINHEEEQTFLQTYKIKYLWFSHEHVSSGPGQPFSASVGVYRFVFTNKDKTEEMTFYTDTSGKSNKQKVLGESLEVEMLSATADQKTVTLSVNQK